MASLQSAVSLAFITGPAVAAALSPVHWTVAGLNINVNNAPAAFIAALIIPVWLANAALFRPTKILDPNIVLATTAAGRHITPEPERMPWKAIGSCWVLWFCQFIPFAVMETLLTPLLQQYFGWITICKDSPTGASGAVLDSSCGAPVAHNDCVSSTAGSQVYINILYAASAGISLIFVIGLKAMGKPSPGTARARDSRLMLATLAVNACGTALLAADPLSSKYWWVFGIGVMLLSAQFQISRAVTQSMYSQLIPHALQGKFASYFMLVGSGSRLVAPLWAVHATDWMKSTDQYEWCADDGSNSLLMAGDLPHTRLVFGLPAVLLVLCLLLALNLRAHFRGTEQAADDITRLLKAGNVQDEDC
eukprot:NODE_1501_length_1316_cov_27.374264_g1488_i0.p1 GENE.NODE_1501_length_1316_cov_27.374264_g1488_i0~~NODE_1501_length_1316_cov_27.374264_g1488_i0.p1  ORF type:complete len:411 (+),score=53.96 NODE_1501_length_1316_cov_27.374264_g1488_i0:146-1234(+)